MKIKTLVAAVIALPFAVSAGSAVNSDLFNKLDKDRDGVISKQEAAKDSKLVKEYSKIDADSSGGIEIAEFAAFEPAEAFTPVEAENEPIGAAPTK